MTVVESVTDDYHQNVLSNLLLPHEVLVVHYAYFVVLSLPALLPHLTPFKFVELGLEIGEKFIHTPSQPVEKVFAYVVLEHDVLRVDVAVDLQIVLELRDDYSLDPGQTLHVAQRLRL